MRATLVLALAAVSVLACSAGVGSPATTSSAPAAGGSGGGASGGYGAGGLILGGSGPGGGSSGSAGSPAGCVASTQEAQLTPIDMVFMYDKSGSMGDDPNGQWANQSLRWDPLKAGMIDFFQNAGAQGVDASLQFFPAAGDKEQTCHANYAAPMVTMRSLADPKPFVSALNATVPGGGTPTLPAVMGGISYAQQLAQKDPLAKALLVLVTDGEPAIYNPTTKQIETDCAPVGSTLSNTISDIAGIVGDALTGTPSIPTYVIGIGSADALSSLATIATAGGTDLILIDPVDPTQTRSQLAAQLQAIRSKHFSCDVPLPAAPVGQDLDLGRVNVDFSHSNGTTDEFVRSDDCSSLGWHYDSSTSPTKITLCPNACDAIQADTAGTLALEVGCVTRIP